MRNPIVSVWFTNSSSARPKNCTENSIHDLVMQSSVFARHNFAGFAFCRRKNWFRSLYSVARKIKYLNDCKLILFTSANIFTETSIRGLAAWSTVVGHPSTTTVHNIMNRGIAMQKDDMQIIIGRYVFIQGNGNYIHVTFKGWEKNGNWNCGSAKVK